MSRFCRESECFLASAADESALVQDASYVEKVLDAELVSSPLLFVQTLTTRPVQSCWMI